MLFIVVPNTGTTKQSDNKCNRNLCKDSYFLVLSQFRKSKVEKTETKITRNGKLQNMSFFFKNNNFLLLGEYGC